MIRVAIFFTGLILGVLVSTWYFTTEIKSLVTREYLIGQIHLGMKRSEISELLLKESKPIEELHQEIVTKCGDNSSGLSIKGNPNWEMARFEDFIEIYFNSEHVVCAFKRYGL